MSDKLKVSILLVCVAAVLCVFFYYQSTLSVHKTDSIAESQESAYTPSIEVDDVQPSESVSAAASQLETPAPSDTSGGSEIVYASQTGSKYHSVPDCGRMNPDNAKSMTISEAKAAGLTPCSRCIS